MAERKDTCWFTVQPLAFCQCTIYPLIPIIFIFLVVVFLFVMSCCLLSICSIKWLAGGIEILNVIRNCKIQRNIRNGAAQTPTNDDNEIIIICGKSEWVSNESNLVSVRCSTTVQACNYLVWLGTHNRVRFKSVSCSHSRLRCGSQGARICAMCQQPQESAMFCVRRARRDVYFIKFMYNLYAHCHSIEAIMEFRGEGGCLAAALRCTKRAM